MQTWGGPLFFMQAQKRGSNNWCMSLSGGAIIFYAKLLGSRSQSFFCKYNMEHILYLMTVEYKHGFLMTVFEPCCNTGSLSVGGGVMINYANHFGE